jgi:hypothetical protein
MTRIRRHSGNARIAEAAARDLHHVALADEEIAHVTGYTAR